MKPIIRPLVAVLALAASSLHAQVTRRDLSVPTQTPTEVEAERHLKEGQRLLSEDAFAEAAKQFEAAVAQDPLLFMAHFGLGTARMSLKEFPAAVTAFEAARKAFQERAEKNKHAMFRTQGAREERMRKLRDAIRNNSTGASGRAAMEVQEWEAELRSLEMAAEDDSVAPLPPGLLLALGSAYFRTGRLPEAEREYRAAVEVQPKLGEARNNLAVILLMTGRAPEAQEQAKLAKKSGFKVPPALMADIDKAVAEGPKKPN